MIQRTCFLICAKSLLLLIVFRCEIRQKSQLSLPQLLVFSSWQFNTLWNGLFDFLYSLLVMFYGNNVETLIGGGLTCEHALVKRTNMVQIHNSLYSTQNCSQCILHFRCFFLSHSYCLHHLFTLYKRNHLYLKMFTNICTQGIIIQTSISREPAIF